MIPTRFQIKRKDQELKIMLEAVLRDAGYAENLKAAVVRSPGEWVKL